MELLQELLLWSCLFCRKKHSRYGYSIIHAANEASRVSLLSNISLDRPLSGETLDFVEDHQDELVACLKDLKTSRILLEIPALGRRFTNQLAEHSFHESFENELTSEKDEILKQNLIYLASYTNNVDRLQQELLARKVLSFGDFTVAAQHKHPILKAVEMYKAVFKQKDSLGFVIGALKVTGSDYVAEVLIGSFPEAGAELICRISLTEAYSPEFSLKGNPKKYRSLLQIPKERQDILTSITCAYIETKGKTLLKSLEFCQQLTTLKLIDIKLRKEFCSKVDENNNSQYYNSLGDVAAKDDWNIEDIWNMDIDISLKIGGRTVLLVDHIKSRLFSRLENSYTIPENMVQPQGVRNLSLGWCRMSKSSVPFNLSRLHLYSVNFVDSGTKSREDLNVILRNSYSLREFKMWGCVTAQQLWLILRSSCFPPKLKTLAASFVELKIDSEIEPSRNLLENICLFFYKIENEDGFLELIGNCKRISLINFPPYQTPKQEELLQIMQRRKLKQIVFCGCEHSINFEQHFLYFQKEVVERIKDEKNFMMFTQNKLWNSKPLNKSDIMEHLHSKFSFEVLYSIEAFQQHEILSCLWK
ncbi:unnamed protein product [Allacma fusca]|uniref:Uncharacterized protein n=1 Tax=Allacma fusca TaxID=39272 RepID=A0A8J2K6I7_9HEXA|nr:unnamed protein product [Allacma fusca]